MDLIYVLSAVVFTLLAIVVATSLFKRSSPSANVKSHGAPGGLDQSEPEQNGSVPDERHEAAEAWSEISGSSHDHGEVDKSVQAEEPHTHPHTDADSAAEASSERSHGSFIGLSEKELLKCAFSSVQSEGATESPEIKDANDSLKYVPGKARSHHLQVMMSKQELEEEQRVQCEQLAAIFQLLKDNKETFGEVSEGDIEEQLRLYSI